MGREGTRVRVRAGGSECAECGACGIFAPRGGREVEFMALDEVGVREGDEVLMEIPDRALLISFLVVFGLPLLAMVAAYLLVYFPLHAMGLRGCLGLAVLTAVVAGVTCFWVGVMWAGRASIRPRVTSVVEEAPSNRDG